jgi:3',5'-cyclic AMP phosphodiesterase CpdA
MSKTKTQKPKKTAKQRLKKFFKVLIIIILIIAILCGACALVSVVGISSNRNFIQSSITPVEYESQLVPTLDENGDYTFVTDNDFKVMQLSDIHIGGGFMSTKKDNMALNAVSAMISEEKPDLVIVTGDIAYPVPFQAGTFNNKNSAMLFADLMEQLGVYWCLAFGNHDTELYSYYTREQIAELYENKDKYPHCIFQSGPEDVDGVGNYAVNVKNSNGDITQSFIMFDSHSYTDNDYFGILWKYDCIHKNQIEWYKEKIASLTEENNGVTPKSLAFFHIPLIEMQQAYYEYRDNGFQDTDDVKYLFGKIGEKEEMICSSAKNEGLFDAMLEVGSTQGVFFGHDHLNNMSLNYKGIQLTYTYSIDYLAYSGIAKYGLQRGCTLINVSPDGEFEISQENYYQDKYQATNTKEEVTMADYRDYE